MIHFDDIQIINFVNSISIAWLSLMREHGFSGFLWETRYDDRARMYVSHSTELADFGCHVISSGYDEENRMPEGSCTVITNDMTWNCRVKDGKLSESISTIFSRGFYSGACVNTLSKDDFVFLYSTVNNTIGLHYLIC